MKVGIAKIAEMRNNFSVRSASFCWICLEREWIDGGWYSLAVNGWGTLSNIKRIFNESVGVYLMVVSHSDPLRGVKL